MFSFKSLSLALVSAVSIAGICFIELEKRRPKRIIARGRKNLPHRLPFLPK